MATPYMSLVLPTPFGTPGATPGPAWATMLNAALALVDQHDHTAGKGVSLNLTPVTATAGATYTLSDWMAQVATAFAASHAAVALTAVGAVPNANGASLSGQTLTLQPADATHPGVLTAADWATFNTGARAYDILFSSIGSPSANQVLARVVMSRSVTIPINSTGSVGSARVNPTALATILVKKNDVTAVTITISTLGVFTFTNAAPISLVSGDVLTLVAQASPDATLADVAITLAGTL